MKFKYKILKKFLKPLFKMAETIEKMERRSLESDSRHVEIMSKLQVMQLEIEKLQKQIADGPVQVVIPDNTAIQIEQMPNYNFSEKITPIPLENIPGIICNGGETINLEELRGETKPISEVTIAVPNGWYDEPVSIGENAGKN